jgi:hypothetical protein
MSIQKIGIVIYRGKIQGGAQLVPAFGNALNGLKSKAKLPWATASEVINDTAQSLSPLEEQAAHHLGRATVPAA